MFDSLIVVAILIIVLWLGAMAYYLFVSRQQSDLADEIEKLREQLDEIEEGI
jgi:Zn-dependent protease with chaperone function